MPLGRARGREQSTNRLISFCRFNFTLRLTFFSLSLSSFLLKDVELLLLLELNAQAQKSPSSFAIIPLPFHFLF